MRLKLYRAAGIAEAMARVRAEMGPDALILATRRVADGVEVLARACAAFLGKTPPLAGIIRRDDRVKDAIRRQTLVLVRHPAAPAAADVEAVAHRLCAD